jgi:hypothetical protein
MRAPLEIPTARHYWRRIIWLYVGLSPFVLLGLAQASRDWGRPERQDMAYAMIGVVIVMLALPTGLLLARRLWVARMDSDGVMLRNGRRFAWSSFKAVEPIKNRRVRIINHYDLVFAEGRAGVFFRMAANQPEVEQVIVAIARGQNPFRAPS